jgi:magnesium-transporting ATPase (P-type)
MLPREVFVRAGPEVTARRAGDLQIGDVVVIKPGARIPVDGLVVSGHSFVDQAAITGESLPVEKITGAGVYAGTINQAGRWRSRRRATGCGSLRPRFWRPSVLGMGCFDNSCSSEGWSLTGWSWSALAPRSWCGCYRDRCEASCDWSSPSGRSSRE